ncbi:hypothetical protein [Massilia sp. TN1-12]|uniref:hypothetical protein n=1 Tax=Massilia paldalensis TaxID=3377675 RepID=UPI00384FBE32
MTKVLSMNDLLSDEIELIKNYRKGNDDAKASISQYAEKRAAGLKGRTDLNGLTVPDDGLIHLHDLNFDFEGYFERYPDNLEEGEDEEFQARIYGMFCRDVFTCGGDMERVSLWASNYVAERLYQALGGVPWQDIMGLPWDEPTPFFSPIGQRAAAIYAGVQNALKDDPNANKTNLIAEHASKHNRGIAQGLKDYYAFKNAVDGVKEMPRNFIKNPPEK